MSQGFLMEMAKTGGSVVKEAVWLVVCPTDLMAGGIYYLEELSTIWCLLPDFQAQKPKV